MSGKVNLSDINIMKNFAESVPREEKLNKCREMWNQFHRQDRYVVIDSENNLIDGYIQYLVLKENGVTEAEIKRKKRWCRKNVKNWTTPQYRNEETTYIYGMHYNRKKHEFSKEYVWRVPKSWSEIGWENNLLPGDDILVSTKRGLKPVTITKIIRTDQCPVDIPVRRVKKRL